MSRKVGVYRIWEDSISIVEQKNKEEDNYSKYAQLEACPNLCGGKSTNQLLQGTKIPSR
jgi:hypothetical protein